MKNYWEFAIKSLRIALIASLVMAIILIGNILFNGSCYDKKQLGFLIVEFPAIPFFYKVLFE